MDNTIFWMALAAYALHIMEEFFYDWQDWAQEVLHLQVNWTGFYVTNVVVLFLGVTSASIGWSNPIIALAYPGLMLINTIFFHIMPVIIKKKFSPGVITACLLFLPICFFTYKQAIDNGISISTILGSIFIGALIMAYPIVLLKTKDLPFFNQKG